MTNYFYLALLLIFLTGAYSHAEEIVPSEQPEERYMISNGQGISSPSFSDGLFGQNPAGLVLNHSLKFKAIENLGTFAPATTFNGAYPSGSLLMGNGILGAGVNGGGRPYESLDWGISGRVQTIFATFGVSSHTTFGVTPSLYDAGALFEPVHSLRFGFMIPHINVALDAFAGGVTYLYSDSIEVVVDADYDSKYSLGVFKPGITFRTDYLQATAAYGLRYLGTTDALLYSGLTAGVGVRVIEPVLLTYEYGGLTTHRLSVTLRILL